VGVYWVGRAVPVYGLLGLQVLGWALQLVGHYYFEKKAPAFTDQWHHFFVGPLWIFSKLVGYEKV
jgi:uncharacterized membrane protein YGL010W